MLSVLSCFKFQLEKLWADILTCVQSRHCGPYNSDLLTIMSPLLVCIRLILVLTTFSNIFSATPKSMFYFWIIQQSSSWYNFVVAGGDSRSSQKKHQESCCHVLECHVRSLANIKIPRKPEVCEIVYFCNWHLGMYFLIYLVYYFLLQTSSSGCQRQNVAKSTRLGKRQGVIA